VTVSRQFVVRFDGPLVKDHSVPFKTLADVLDGIQNTFYYIAMEITKREVKSRARIPMDILQACELRRVLEKPGSYQVVAEISAPVEAEIFQGLDLGKSVLDKYMETARWISESEDVRDIEKIFPETRHRTRILKSIEKYSPREGDDWALVFEDGVDKRYIGTINAKARKRITQAINMPMYSTMTITGKLMRIHLDEYKMYIQYPPTGKLLDCHYSPESEDFIIESRNGYIQLNGMIEADESGNPQKIVKVNYIQELDLSPVKLSIIRGENITLKLSKPIIMEPLFENQEIVLYYDDFNIIASGQNRDEAVKDFEQDFIWLWQEYALADDDSLSVDAITMKLALKDMVGRVLSESEKA
jgi:hypothetical protein